MTVWNHFTGLELHRYVTGRNEITFSCDAKENTYGDRQEGRLNVPCNEMLSEFGIIRKLLSGSWEALVFGDHVEYQDLGTFPTALRAVRALLPHSPGPCDYYRGPLNPKGTTDGPLPDFSGGSEDPDFSLKDWKHAVANDETLLGYAAWVVHEREAKAE